MAAEKIRQALGEDRVDIFNVSEAPLINLEFYQHLILGIPTWDYGELQEHWEEVWPELDEVDFQDRQVALFGLGDQIGYPEWFLDAMGYLHSKVVNRGAIPAGYWSIEGYSFEASKALTADGQYFVGLALDDETQFKLTDQRIHDWCAQLKAEWQL